MVEMCKIIDKSKHINVDEWDTDANPISPEDRIFRNMRGEVILPIAELFYRGDPERSALNYFVMNPKRSYNSDDVRNHICRYLNYFEKFYDYDKELIMIMHRIKLNIDYIRTYEIENFMDDVNRYLIRNNQLMFKVKQFVDDNYLMKLSSNNNKTPNLQFNDSHAKVLYEISLLMNMYIPLSTHYMYIHGIKLSGEIQEFMLRLFDMCACKYQEERGIDIYNKMYETAISVVNKSKNPDKLLWEKNQIRGNNTTTHTKDSVIDIIMNIMPKYNYDNNIVTFNYCSNRKCLKYKITDIRYEYPFCKMSSSKRDADQNSEYDRYEARLNKKDEALAMQNKVSAEETVKKIEALYGPFSDAEIDHYRKKLIRDGMPVINEFQRQLVSYMYDSEFGDPITMLAVRNQRDYIKLIIAAKRILLDKKMVLLPYIISSRIVRIATRKVINKKDTISIETDSLYQQIKQKYNNPKIEQKMFELIGAILSSSFEIIDFDEIENKPTEYDGRLLPIISDIIKQEVMEFIMLI